MSDIRTFESGATRDKADHKNDYEGFFSPLVIRAYGDYMQKHRVQADGSIRDSDNWQHGFGFPVLMKSMWRHFVDLWTIHRGYRAFDFDGKEVFFRDAICGIMFNVMGYFHELLVKEMHEEIKSKFEDALQALPAFHGETPILGKDFLVSEEHHCIKCLLPKHHCHCGD